MCVWWLDIRVGPEPDSGLALMRVGLPVKHKQVCVCNA